MLIIFHSQGRRNRGDTRALPPPPQKKKKNQLVAVPHTLSKSRFRLNSIHFALLYLELKYTVHSPGPECVTPSATSV